MRIRELFQPVPLASVMTVSLTPAPCRMIPLLEIHTAGISMAVVVQLHWPSGNLDEVTIASGVDGDLDIRLGTGRSKDDVSILALEV